MPSAELQLAAELMTEFGRSTGLVDRSQPPRRYLWTDAFAVCNFLALYRASREGRYRQHAVDLVAQVHETLGKHRPEDSRCGWISGLDEAAGHEHPTVGGLRIGKPLPERRPDAPLDDRLEWERDGQYYHYLTKWMHALNLMSAETGDVVYGRWARELASTSHGSFRQPSGRGGKGPICWKMSIDLSHPLVPFAGQHDPPDGLATCLELRARSRPGSDEAAELDSEVQALFQLCVGGSWSTEDPLGLGGLLFDACRILQLGPGTGQREGVTVLPGLLSAALDGTIRYSRGNTSKQPVARRLAFRELGLAIGLRGVARMQAAMKTESWANSAHKDIVRLLRELALFSSLGGAIESTWRQRTNRQSRSWNEHGDINSVMLATAMVPDLFLSV